MHLLSFAVYFASLTLIGHYTKKHTFQEEMDT